MADLLKRLVALVEKLAKIEEGALPRLEQGLVKTAEVLFAPRQLAIQIALSTALHLTVIGWRVTGRTVESLWRRLLSEKGRRIYELEYRMERSRNYQEWLKLASELDVLRGLDKWRQDERDTPLLDAKLMRRRIRDTERMLDSGDLFDLMFRLRGGLAREQYGASHEGLYTSAVSGTKLIVDEYHAVCSKALNYICDTNGGEVPDDVKLAFFNETRHSYGRTALLLSGGAYLGYYHFGLAKCLFLEGLLPRVISGASAGSLMAAVIGTKTDRELEELWNLPEGEPDTYRRDYFSISSVIKSPLGKQIASLMPESLKWLTGPLLSLLFDGKLINLDIQHLQRVVIENVGMWTFQEAFDRTGRIINITVAPLNNYDPPRLLNYLTAPHVCVWSAAVASCAIPGVFDPCLLYVREPNGNYRQENEWTRSGPGEDKSAATLGGGYSDGSIENDLPMQQLSELFNVNHFIVSQVNPHSALLSALSLKVYSHSAWATSPILRMVVGYTHFLKSQCRDWLRNIISFISFRPDEPSWKTKRGLATMLTQSYEGRANDVTIMPWGGHLSVLQAWASLIKNPTDKEYLEVVRAAENATWPFLARIRAQCSVEMTLDRCVQRLRRRLASGSGRHHAKGGMDRTPSFYTSRSIINLSGLGVADPMPNVDHFRGDGHGHFRGTRSASASSPAQSNQSTANNSCNSLAEDADWAASAPTVETEEPLHEGRASPKASLNAGEQPQGDESGVYKTTSMAGFYYKGGSKINSSREEIRQALSEHQETVGLSSTPPRAANH